jgi:hypothetical protein
MVSEGRTGHNGNVEADGKPAFSTVSLAVDLPNEKAPETEANPIPIAYRLRGFVKRANWRNQMIDGSICISSKHDDSFNKDG